MYCDLSVKRIQTNRYSVLAPLGHGICRQQIAATQLRTLGSKIGIDTCQQRSKLRQGTQRLQQRRLTQIAGVAVAGGFGMLQGAHRCVRRIRT